MKFFLVSLLVVLSICSYSQETKQPFDSALASSLGADEYGMKMYVFVVLKTGENKTTNQSFIDSCFAGHMKNIQQLAASKKLVIAGPFGSNSDSYRGLFIFNTESVEEAKKWMEGDPAVKADLLRPVMYPWYGSAALPMYLEYHQKIKQKSP